ncbi:MAG TPA: hypothetical protein VGE72_05315 [Azospirillum sp.]
MLTRRGFLGAAAALAAAPVHGAAAGPDLRPFVALSIENLDGRLLAAGRYVSFGHAFRRGDVVAGRHPVVLADDGAPVPVQQVDHEAAGHDDGSLSFAAFALKLPRAIPAGGRAAFRIAATAGEKPRQPSSLSAAALRPFGYRVILAVGGEEWEASLASALDGPANRIVADGPVCREWRCVTPFRRGGVAHPDLWCCFHARLHEDGRTVRLAARVGNGWMGNGVNHVIERAVLANAAGPIAGFAWSDIRHTHHSAWFAFDADALPHWTGGRPHVAVRVDARHAADALAVWHYDPAMAGHIGPPSAMDYSATRPAGYVPDYVPGDRAGYSANTAAYGDNADRGELGPLPSWSVAHLLTGSGDWARYDRIHALALATAPILYTREGGEPPVLVERAYPGLPKPEPATGWGANGTIVDPPEANGWKGTDRNTAGRGPRIDSSHWPNGALSSWLVTGDPWFLDLLIASAVHAVGVVDPDRRRRTVGRRTFSGLVAPNNEVRGAAWAMRDLCNAAWLCPDRHPAKPYLEDLVAGNWTWWAATLGPDGAVDGDQKALGWVVGGGAEQPMWAGDALAVTMLMSYRRRRPHVDALVDAFVRRWVFGRMGGGPDPGCIRRAFAHRVAVRDGPGGRWHRTWGELRVGARNAAKEGVPYLPDGGCPEGGLEDGDGLPIRWPGWWRYERPNAYPAIGHMAAACGVIAGIAEAEVPYRLLNREDRVPMASWAQCPRYRIRPPV